MNGSQLLRKALYDASVNFIFGYTGGAIMPFYDEMEKIDSHTKVIQSRNEQGATFMAQGVSRGSVNLPEREIGAAISTSGPGATNLVTGVADALMDSVPILTISGQVPTGVIGTDAFQETDVVGMLIPLTKQTYMPTNVCDIEEMVHEAIFIANKGRPGPVHIDIPKDVQFSEAESAYSFDAKKYKPVEYLREKYNLEVDQEKIYDSINLINKAKRPVIFCGHGVRITNSGKQLLKFAEMVNAPIATTLHGLSSFPADHKLHLGWMGMHGSVEANRAIQNADLIIAFGMRFDDRVTGKLDEYAKDADVIHVEIDPSEIDKNVRTTIAINADVRDALEEFINSKQIKKQQRTEWFNQIEEFKKETGDWHEKDLNKGIGKEGKLLMKTIISKLSKISDGQDLLVMDVGQQQMIASKYYEFKKVNSCFNSGGAGTMGASLPMSMGVKLVRPKEVVWSINGDGGFQMNIQELGTVMEYDIDIKIIILNNNFLGMVRQWQTLFFDGRYAGTPMLNPDYSKIASAYGIPYQKVEKVTEIEPILKKVRKRKGAQIVEFVCDASEMILPMVPSGAKFEEMIINPPTAS